MSLSLVLGGVAVACCALAAVAYSYSNKHTFEPDDFYKCKLLKFGYPVYFILYFLTITLVPILNGVEKGDCATTHLPLNSEIIVGVAIFMGLMMDLCLAMVLKPVEVARETSVEKTPNIPLFPPDSWVVLLFTGVLAKVDTYTDIAFIVIAHSCGSPLWVPAVSVLCIAIFFSQCGPMCVGGLSALVSAPSLILIVMKPVPGRIPILLLHMLPHH
jgi:hypothetical protein